MSKNILNLDYESFFQPTSKLKNQAKKELPGAVKMDMSAAQKFFGLEMLFQTVQRVK